MKLNIVMSRSLAALMILFTLFACQNDFQEVGSGLVDGRNFTSGSSTDYLIKAYNKTFFNGTGLQTNGLNTGVLGFYEDPVFGNTTASYLTQVGLSTYNPGFGENPVLDTVVIDITYYSNSAVNEVNETEYTLDSVYGSEPIKLTAYRSEYFLNDLAPPDFTENAVYYSNDLESLSGLEGEVLFVENEFVPSNEAIVTAETTDEEGNVSTTTVSPRLRLTLTDVQSIAYWQEAILNQGGSDRLYNANAFRSYFKGIYFKAEPINDAGNYFLFNPANSGITLKYTSGPEDNRRPASIELNFSGNSVVGYQNDFKPEITEANLEDSQNGDENLYLKGGQGSMAVVELFGPDDDDNGIPDQLEVERSKKRLVREANLEFFVNEQLMEAIAGSPVSGAPRIYVYNVETNRTLADFSADATQSDNGAVIAVGNSHLGPLSESDSGLGYSYKIRITEYVKGLLNPDNENPNTKIGVVVAQNLTLPGTGSIEGAAGQSPSRVPFTSILAQQSTILYGSMTPDEDRRLKLKIYYSEATNP